jgi:hypothetical protein
MPHSESVLPIGVPIAPTEPTDGNSTHIAEYGRGGLHAVADVASRNAIATDRKKVGMLVWVESEEKYFRLASLPNTWVELSSGAGAVTSVNGETGDVVLDATDVGAAPAVHTHAIADVSGLQTALDGKAATSHTHTASQISDSSAVGRSVLTAADAAAARTAISAAAASHTHPTTDITGLGALATLNSVDTLQLDNQAVTYQKMEHCTAYHVLGRANGNGVIQELSATAMGQSLLAVSGVKATLQLLGLDEDDEPNFAEVIVGNPSLTSLTLDSNSLTSSGGPLTLSANGGSDNVTIDANLTQTGDLQVTGFFSFAPNGEFIQNTTNGRMDFMPAPVAANAFGVYMDFTSFTVGARMGVIRASDGAKNPAGSYIQYETQLAVLSNINTVFGNNAEVVMQVTTTGNDTFQIAPVPAAGRSAAVAIVNQSHVGVANRSPATEHVDPTLYVYSSDGAQALDYVRVSHDQTDGVIEAGAGRLRLKGASVVRIEGPSGGFDILPTAGSNGQVFTTDGTNASWQTGDKVSSNTTGVTGADQITNMMSMTQAEYDAITPNASTFYVIVG